MKNEKEKTRWSAVLPRGGQAALAVTFLVGGIVVFVGITLAFIVIAFLNSSLGFVAANQAGGLTAAGVYDVLLQLARNKDFSSAAYCLPAENTPCPLGYAQIVVSQDSPSAGFVFADGIAARMSLVRRELDATISISSSTGEARVVKWDFIR